jgi:drug/metabolite transporter (DMT)-like permease
VVAVVLGAVVLGERLPLVAFGGLALILAGALAVSSRVPAKPLISAATNVPDTQ